MTLRRPTREASRETVPVAAPPRVASWLAGWLAAAPDGPVRALHICRDTVHLDVGGRAVGVATATAPGLPHVLRTNLADLASAGSSGEPPTAYVESGILRLGGRVLVTGRLVDVRAPRIDAARIPTASPVAAQGTPRSRGAGLVPPLPAPQDSIEASTIAGTIDAGTIDAGTIDAATVDALVGRGDGLTPLGDDVLSGWLVAHRAAGVATPAVDAAVRRSLRRTTTLSATLLECALAGECPDLVAGYLRALGTPGEHGARTALTALGHSSGAGMAYGVDLALADLARQAAA